MVIFFANATLRSFGIGNPISNLKQTNLADPEIIGPDKLCIVFGSVIGDFFAAGDPAEDVYSWEIIGPSGQELYMGSGGEKFQTISYTFSLVGKHKIKLVVTRGGLTIKEDEKEVELIQGPTPTLGSSYSICSGNEITLQAISPASPGFNDYVFEWKDGSNGSGNIVGDQNTFKTSTLGEYSVSFYFVNELGEPECTTIINTKVDQSGSVDIIASRADLCPGDFITYTTDPPTVGDWSFEKDGDGIRIPLQSAESINISSIIDLNGPGDYVIFYKLEDTLNPICSLEKSMPLTYYTRPDFEFLEATGSSGCLTADGAITIKALTVIDQLLVDGTNVSSTSLMPGDVVTLSGLKSGLYSVIGVLGSCRNILGTAVPLIDPPLQLEFNVEDIQPEICTATGKLNGSFLMQIINGNVTGKYKVINERGSVIRQGDVTDQSEVLIEIPGGIYYVELFNEDGCSLPKSTKVDIPALNQVNFFVPPVMAVCQSFEYIPKANDPLEFTLTFPDNHEETVNPGDSFTLTMAGDYSLTGRLPGQTDICPRTKDFTVNLVNPVDFEPKLIKEDCFGNKTYKADIFGIDPLTVTFKWYNEIDELVSEGEFLYPITYGLYKLDVQPANSNACPIAPKEILIEKPILSVDLVFTKTKLCELGPGANISLAIDQPQAVNQIRWRRFDDTGNIIPLPQFNNKKDITVTDAGTYEASAYSIIPKIGKDCELGRATIQVDETPERVTFDVPITLEICETYDFIPTSSQPIVFDIVRPNKTKITINAGESVTLDQNGDYTFFGYNPDLDYPLCPEIKTMNVIVYRKISFTPELFQEDCNGQKIYKANIGSTDPADALFTWADAGGNPIGTDQFLTLNTYGDFSLNVQPKGSLPCDQTPIEFFVETPTLTVTVSLSSDPLCPDAAAAAIRADADFTEVKTIEWWFTDPSGLQTELIAERGEKEILGIKEGTYEVRIFNDLPCLLGFDKLLLLRSTDTVRPKVETEYQVCPKYEIGPQINPGAFASYEWYFEGNLISTAPTYKPLQIGEYTLNVYSAEGCVYEAEFTTEEECELRAIYPNAIEPKNPAKPFLIYTNYLIDEMEVYIFNKWGQMVFQCTEKNLISEESTCRWDGKYNGKDIPNGSYAIRINYRNLEKGISKTELGAIMVIE